MRTTRTYHAAPWRRTRGAGHEAHRRVSQLAADARLRSSEPSEDSAHYACDCGHAFRAEPSTTVACPRCGSGHDW